MPADDPKTEEVHIQLLQRSLYEAVNVFSCRVQVDQSIKRCEMFSHSIDLHEGESRFTKIMSREICLNMIRYNQLQYDNIIVRDLIVNATNYRSLTVARNLSEKGKCDGAGYVYNDHEFSDVYVNVKLETSLYTHRASLQFDTNDIIYRRTTHVHTPKLSALTEPAIIIFGT